MSLRTMQSSLTLSEWQDGGERKTRKESAAATTATPTPTPRLQAEEITFFTVATEYTTNLVRLQKQFTYWGQVLHVVGLGHPLFKKTGWRYGYKLIWLREFLQRRIEDGRLRDDSLVLCLDSNDVILNFPQDSAEEEGKKFHQHILTKFYQYDTDILFSGHSFFGPKATRYIDPELHNERLAAVCSGLYLGRAKAMLDYLVYYPPAPKTDDQQWWVCRYYAQIDPRWNETPDNPDAINRKMLALDPSDKPSDKFLDFLNSSNSQSRFPAPQGRIKIEFRGDLFSNLGVDSVNLYSRFTWKPELKQWVCPLNQPYSGVGKFIEQEVCKRIPNQLTPRPCNPARPVTVEAPLFLHFEGGPPKYAIWMFSRRISAAYDLTKHDSKQDSIWWEVSLISLTLLVVLLTVLLLVLKCRSGNPAASVLGTSA